MKEKLEEMKKLVLEIQTEIKKSPELQLSSKVKRLKKGRKENVTEYLISQSI